MNKNTKLNTNNELRKAKKSTFKLLAKFVCTASRGDSESAT